MNGGLGEDILLGSEGGDLINGGDGNDTALMGAGNDVFTWNPGDDNDTLEGQDGFDQLQFNGANIAENITISANGGRVLFFRDIASVTMDLNDVEQIRFQALGGADNIVVNDLSGTDVPAGEVQVDLAASVGGGGDAALDRVTVNGAAGNEAITIVAGPDGLVVSGASAPVTVFNAEGTDQLIVKGNAGNDVINAPGLAAGAITLTLDGGLGNDTLVGGDGVDTFLGDDGNDIVIGARGNDTAFLGAGDDVFVWNPGEGSDVVEGQAGVDTLGFVGSNGNENIDISANGARTRFFRDVASITMDLDDVEHVEFHALGGADNIVINDLSGTDVPLGRVLVDLQGVLGAGTGDGQVDRVTVNSTAGNDVIGLAGSVNGTITITGTPAPVTILFSEGSDQLVVNGGNGDDSINAAAVAAGAAALTINGGAGNDTIVGSQGADLMLGGDGNDAYFVDNAGDLAIENANEGNDTVFSTAHLRLSANLETLVLQGAADLQGAGNTLVNVLQGNAGNNILDGDAGADAMFGGAGSDIYFVDDAGDVAIENLNEGNDTVFSTANLRLSANVEALVLQGVHLQGAGNSLVNTIHGNAGNNILDGDAGADAMFGGAGNDVYFVDNAGDLAIENANEGNDSVFSTANLRLSANVEALVLQGTANLQGAGNSLANAILRQRRQQYPRRRCRRRQHVRRRW